MARQRRRSAADSGTLPSLDGPSVLILMESMEEQRGAIVGQLRHMALSLPAVEERAVYDGFCREWTPAYYIGGRQLFHVHNFRSGLRATVFVGVNTLEPALLDSEEVPPELRSLVANTPGPRGTKMVKVPLGSVEEAAAFVRLVRAKWMFVQSLVEG